MATLLGPPELSKPQPTPVAVAAAATTTTTTTAVSEPFIDLMVSKFNNPKPPMGLTENQSATFLSTGNPCLDFFFHVVPDTPSDSLRERLDVAWAHNPLTTLKLVCNLRGVRGTGKSDREGFYTAAMWLFSNHPKTLAANVPSFAEFGYFKDLPEVLYRILEGSDVRKDQKAQWLSVKGSRKRNRLMKMRETRWGRGRGRGAFQLRRGRGTGRNLRNARNKEESMKKKTFGDFLVGLKPFENSPNEMMKKEKETARSLREQKKVSMAKKLLNLYNDDANFQLLHDSISDHFANCLKNDLELLNSGKSTDISLAAKWCPSLDSSFDRSTLLCESIARRMFPRTEYEGIEEAHYAYRIRDRLRKEVLVPLRKILELPEVYMSEKRWDSIPYNRVASVAMKLYKEKFLKHDKERFLQYLVDVKSGKTTIAAGALLPHEIIQSLQYRCPYRYENSDEDEDEYADEYEAGDEVAELQWSRMVSDMLKKGKLKNCLAVCDVSGSMHGTPMDVCVALGLLVSELNEEPWKGKVITFSADPELHLIEGDSLYSKTSFIREMKWGMNTDFQRVFDRILEVAVDGNLKEDQMIKRVFVFSDMEFDQASATPWETDYQAITRKYSEKGYGSAVPQIVFWNLRDSRATPVAATQQGVALVSGFSKNLMKLFMNNDGEISPESSMEAAISGPKYQKLVVLD
ncbi:hypothetical protein HN51_049446 [Arachis hypogaea]|uniref:Plant/T31B5-30 protein n=1 Tax=Arachis hypogaea TaxID=3818 RepID=A0A444YF27_ARAHY|nr:uncharacterized protein LOC112765871 [Arachis hypogaea]RYR00524.1 hypothetical protein Ahy_B07g088641 [Arachis hypogaea]